MITKDKCLDVQTNSLNQYHKKCMKGSEENIRIDTGAGTSGHWI